MSQHTKMQRCVGLERISLIYTRRGRYDAELVRWKAENKSLMSDELGYLLVPDEIMIPYALKDVLVPMEAMPQMIKRMQLDKVWDFYKEFVNPLVGNIFTQFTLQGLPVKVPKMDKLRRLYSYARVLLEKDFIESLVEESKGLLCREMLLNSDDPVVAHQTYWEIRRIVDEEHSPARALEIFKQFCGAEKLPKMLPFMEHYLKAPEFLIRSTDDKIRWLFKVKRFDPVKSTANKEKGMPSMQWERVLKLPPPIQKLYSPSTDKQTIKLLADDSGDELLIKLLDVMVVGNVCKAFLKPADLDENGELVKENGIHYWLASDGRIHGMMSCTETWRPRAWRPSYMVDQIKRCRAAVVSAALAGGDSPRRSTPASIDGPACSLHRTRSARLGPQRCTGNQLGGPNDQTRANNYPI